MNTCLLANNLRPAFNMLQKCSLCPRKCGVNRITGQKGFCGAGAKPVVHSWFSHRGEEPPISGAKGSGAIFFTHCTMRCVYCQNYEFSQLSDEKEITTAELARIMLDLQGQGCHNINLVTPTHFVPQIMEALLIASRKGLLLPIVYNTGGYELVSTLKLLDGVVDIYLPDMRYGDDKNASRYSMATDYPAINKKAVMEMFRQVGDLVVDREGIARKGLIIRHLVLPNNIASSEEIFNFISRRISKNIHVSLMSQYHPVYKAANFREISRRITGGEYEHAFGFLAENGLMNGWVQEATDKIDLGLLGTNIKRRA
ncbi:MAG: radical SAM protein [Candidatus Omnitrophica bacterium]|nr:radical SAM protein [Candidatus Omnitrophota bacterium]